MSGLPRIRQKPTSTGWHEGPALPPFSEKHRRSWPKMSRFPGARYPHLIKRCKELAKKYNVEIVVLGHAGDGNLHPSVLTDIKNKEHYEQGCQGHG